MPYGQTIGNAERFPRPFHFPTGYRVCAPTECPERAGLASWLRSGEVIR